MKNLRFARPFPKPFGFALSRCLVICLGLIGASDALGQGDDTPTGLAGGFGGSITTGGGSFDPYERNATRTVTDIVVPGAVIPFTFTRIWNSRSSPPLMAIGWRHNWQWDLEDLISGDSGNSDPNSVFKGYNVHYPDGRVVKFNKPDGAPVGAPGTYSPSNSIQDRFVVQTDHTAQLFLSDGSVVNFDMNDIEWGATSVVDPHGLVVTITYDGQGKLVKEPGGRWIRIGWDVLSGHTNTCEVTTSLGQHATYKMTTDTDGLYAYSPGSTVGPDDDRILTSRAVVTYHDVVDPDTGLPIEAHYLFKTVQPPYVGPGVGTQPSAHGRLTWASDPMFDGPLQQVHYSYVDNSSALNGDVYMSAVREVSWAPNYWDPNLPGYWDPNLQGHHFSGVMVSRVEMPPAAWLSPDYFTRIETRGDGAVRTISYWNSDTGRGQTLVDHFTDFKNDPSKIERHEYNWATGFQPQFQTPTKITDALGHATSQTLEPVLGHVTGQTHPDGSARSWTYTDPAKPFYVATSTDELGHTTTYTRDPITHRVTRIDYPDGGFEIFTYNGFGQVTEHLMTSGGTEKFTYDGRGLKTEYRDPYHVTGNATFRYQYDEKGRLSGVTDARGSYPGDPAYTTNYEYNGRNQLTRTIHPTDPVTGQRYTIQKSYNVATGTLTSTTDELGHPTSYTYDEYNRVLTVTNPLGQTTFTSYALDWKDPLVHTTNNPKYVNTPSGKNTIFEYDANFRKTNQVVALTTADEAWTLFQYDAVGNLTKITDPRFYETRFGYDQRNRKIWMDDPIASDRNSSGHTMNWAYDGVGNKKKETRADGAFRSWDYDSMNRLSRAYDWGTNEPATDRQTTRYDRNTTGTIQWTIDTKGAVVSTCYFDAMNRKTSETYPPDATGTARSENWSYDFAGNLSRHDNPAAQVQIFVYDNRNRQTESYWLNDVGQHIFTSYDPASRVINITTKCNNVFETSVAFGYNEANRQVWEEQTLAGYPTRRVETPRDPDGNRTSLLVWGWFMVRYDYTNRGQLAHIYGSGWEPWFNFSYDPAGNLLKRQGAFVGVNDSVNIPPQWYDPLNRPVMWENTKGGDTFMARSWYQYDTVGREVATWRDEQGGKGERFYYAPTNQLTNVRYNADWVWTGSPLNWDRWVDYGYQPGMLNRWYVNDNANFSWVSAGNLNQYTSIGSQNLTYDTRFNLATYDGGTFTHDAHNQLISASRNGTTVNFTYDGLGRCVRRTVNGATVLIAYDGWKPTVEWNGAGNFLAFNVYGAGPDEILWRYDASVGQHLRYHQDRHGNVTFVLDGVGNVLEKYTYDAFGNPKVTNGDGSGSRASSNYGNRFMFQGREYIPELGIYDYRHRYYHPGLGRFLQTDPTGFDAGDMNLFRYCADDPVDRADPMGLLSGFTKYQLVYNKDQQIDDTHDGYYIEGVPGHENKGSERVQLEVDRSVTTVKSINGTKKGGDTNVTETVSTKGDTPTVHQQIDVRYASGAGPKNREFTHNNEWTHSRDAINSANQLRGELNGWIQGQNMSRTAALNLVRDGGQFGRIKIPSLQQHRDAFMEDQRIKWDRPYANGWRTPDGTLVAPHNPIDRYTGNPLEWNQ